MFIYSMKASTLKFIAVVIISIGLLITLISVIPGTGESVYAANAGAPGKEARINFKNIKTNEDRAGFLRQFGWEPEPEAVENVEVLIPKEFDAVYLKYNEIQKAQSLDLSKYRNKTVQRYTYRITNYPGYNGDVYANLLIYKNSVISGDICSAALNGFMRYFDTSPQMHQVKRDLQNRPHITSMTVRI